MKAYLEKREANLEATEAIVQWQEVCNEEAMAETVGIWDDQCGNRQQTMGSHNPLKWQNIDSGVQGTLKG
jgi:hypothetical protein